MPRKPKVKEEVYVVDSDQTYDPEAITGVRVNEDCEWAYSVEKEYLVKWAWYDSDADTWEPEANVEECTQMLKSFWNHIGMDNKDYPAGYEVHAEEGWIKRARDQFARDFKKEDKEPKKQSRKNKSKSLAFSVSGSGRKRPKKQDKVKELKEFVEDLNESNDSDESDDVPLSQKTPSKARAESPDPSPDPSSSSASDTDDAPLASQSKRRRLQSAAGVKRKADSMHGNARAGPSKAEPPRKMSKTEENTRVRGPGAALQPTNSRKPVASSSTSAPQRHAHREGSLTSLFSGSSSPSPPPPSSSKQPGPSMIRASGKQPNNQASAPQARKPSYLVESKVKQYDPPNLKSGSTLATKNAIINKVPRTEALQNIRINKIPVDAPSADDRRAEPSRTVPPVDFRAVEGDMQDFGAGMDVQSPHDVVLPPPSVISMPRTTQNVANKVPANLSAKSKLERAPIPRKWKWIGELFVDTKGGLAERVCKVKIAEPSEHTPNGLRFNVCLNNGVDSLRFKTLFPASVLQSLLPASAPAAQYAQLGPEDNVDAASLKKLFNYMSSRPDRLITFAPLHLDNAPIALLLVFPPSYQDLCERFSIRADSQKPDSLLAVLLPWAITGAKARELHLRPNPDGRDLPATLADEKDMAKPTDIARALRQRDKYYRDVQYFRFPQWLSDFMSQPNRPYCIWDPAMDGRHKKSVPDSDHLRSILRQCGAQEAGAKVDIRVVFVHVGFLKHLPSLPAFSLRRCKRPELQFVTYGVHHSVPRTRWGIHEIYPIGGVVTFTPGAFKSEPYAIQPLLKLIQDHPLWDLFVAPSVLAMMARDECGSDPMSEYEKGDFFHGDLLSDITGGQIMLVREPPVNKMDENWLQWQIEAPASDPRTLLQQCLRNFSQQFADHDEAKWHTEVLKELLRTTAALQLQPAMMDKYRRFVVIADKGEINANVFDDSVEALTASHFDFKDDYFTADDLRSFKTSLLSKD